MPIEASELATFLSNIHLFRSLSEEQIAMVVRELQERKIAAEVEVVREGAESNSLYLIYSGSVRVTRKSEKDPVATLVKQDYFGEVALLTRRRRTATITTLEPTVVYELTGEKFSELAQKIPSLRQNFSASISSYKLAKRLHFPWVREGEVVYFLATKHPYRLVESLAIPVATLLIPLGLVLLFLLLPAFKLILWVAGIFFLGIALWMVWRTIDWGNDYYIVTNQRVVYLEKVIGLYDSTQEAPLSTILSVGVETDLLGRQLGYGNVIIRTFVGKIIFWHVSNPKQAAAVVEEHWHRSRDISRRVEADAMRFELRKRMGLLPKDANPQTGPAPVVKAPASFTEKLGSNLFKVRLEQGGTITYRKHVFVLLQQVLQPTLALAVLIFILGFEIIHPANPISAFFSSLTSEILFALWLVLFIGSFLWWVYQYIDWRNDIFQVTPDQILDIDRKPLGSEERKAAPLENILSTEARREGFLAYLFNFGTVYISVGGAQMTFQDVNDPATVQQDIDNRRLGRISAKADAQAKADRERLADWFATYHSVNEELRQAGTEIPENPDNPDQPDENGGNEVPEDMDGGSY